MKGKDNYTKIYTGYQGAGRDVYVINSSLDDFKRVLQSYRHHYDMASIFRQIVSLNAAPLQGQDLNPAGDFRQTRSGAFKIEYSLHNGAVYINFLLISKPVTTPAFGLYPVAYDEGYKAWAPTPKPVDNLAPTQPWKSKTGTAHYAAVAGKFDNKEDAGALLHDHVVGAYTKAGFLTTHDVKGAFGMFWIKPGHHKSLDAAQALASIMQQSSLAGRAVNWLVHGAATDTFKATAQILKTQPLASAQERADNKTAGTVQNQNVYFSNPNTSSEAGLKKLCEDAGLGYAGLNTNQRDLRRFSTLKNVGMDMGKKLSMVAAVGGAPTLLGELGAGGADKVLLNGIDAILSGNHLVLAACIVAGGFIAVGVPKAIKPLAATIRCTFGKGNQKWYTSDAALLS